MRSNSDNHLGHPPQPWLLTVSTVVALEMLVRGEGLPGFPDPFSELHPQEIASIAAQLKLESLPNELLNRLQAVIDATVLIQQPWDEGRFVRFDCQSLIPMASVADWQSFAESEAQQRYPNDFPKQYWFLSGFFTAL